MGPSGLILCSGPHSILLSYPCCCLAGFRRGTGRGSKHLCGLLRCAAADRRAGRAGLPGGEQQPA